MNNPLFSIITPTCERPALLVRAIRSVIGQTFKDYEHIVVDDGNDAEQQGL
ncbi:MAG: glycosyltransferase [Victivallaceae bacterium]